MNAEIRLARFELAGSNVGVAGCALNAALVLKGPNSSAQDGVLGFRDSNPAHPARVPPNRKHE
jgi:hypothetical protein